MSTNTGKSDSESVLSRWSRRKLEAERAAVIEDEAPARNEDAAAVTPAADTLAEEQKPLTDADMPAIDTLDADSDFSGFMSPGVSDELRNLALRKLFSAPVFNIRDGLDEYDEDYTSFEKLGDIVTADMKHQAEVQQQKLREALLQESDAVAEAEPDEVEEIEAMDDEDEAEIDAVEEADEPQQVASLSPGGSKAEVKSGHE